MATKRRNIQLEGSFIELHLFSFVRGAWQEYKGLFYAVAAAVFFAVSDVLIHDSSDISHPLIIFLWMSGWMFILSVLCLLVKRPAILYPEDISSYKLVLILALNGLMASTGDVALTIANVLTSPGDAIAINYTAPIHAGLFAVILLRDRCRVWDVILIIISVVGVVLVVRPPLLFGESVAHADIYYYLGIVLAMFSAVMTGSTFVIGAYLGRYNIPPLIVLIFISFAAIIISISLCTIFQRWELAGYSALHVLMLNSVGCAWFLGSLLVFMAVQIESPTLITIVMTSETILVFIGEYIFLDLTTQWSEYLGAALIVAACIGSTALRDSHIVAPNPKQEQKDDEEYLLSEQP